MLFVDCLKVGWQARSLSSGRTVPYIPPDRIRLFTPSSIDIAPQLLQFQRASESLERARRARIDRVVLDWERTSPLPLAPRRCAEFLGVVDTFLRLWRRSESCDFDTFLIDAHRHEAVARRSTQTSRRWFENWRRHALAALRCGLSPRTLLALLRSAAGAKATRTAAKRPLRRTDAYLARFRERLENVIFPNAPGTADPLRYLAAGDGLTTAQV